MARKPVPGVILAALCLCVLPAAAATDEGRWVAFKTGASDFGPTEHQIDRKTIRDEGPYRTFWTRIWVVPLQEALVFSDDERLIFWSQKFAVDCAHQKWGPDFIGSTNVFEQSQITPLKGMKWVGLDPVMARAVCEAPLIGPSSPTVVEHVVLPAMPAIENPQARPMMIGGRPLPLPCLISLRLMAPARDEPIDLANCGRVRVDNAGTVGITRGMIGFEDRSGGGYFYYTDIGQWNGQDILWERVSDGRSGALSYLVGVETEQNILKPQDIAIGSNCAGGIIAARVAGGHLIHDQAADAFDLVQWGNMTQLFQHSDLDGAHCIARLHYSDEGLVGVSLTQTALADDPDDFKRFPFQPCFNRFYNETVAKGRSEMSADEYGWFKRQFVVECTRH